MSETLSPHPSGGSTVRQRLLVALVGFAIVIAASWLALIIITRIDELFLPGQGINVGVRLPGVQQEAEGPEGRINILVMGLDRRPREGKAPARTDTMFVLTIDPQSKTAGILGIPRDLWVEIPYRSGNGFYEDRVNTAYVVGEMQDYPGGGTALVEQVIEHNWGITIDHYVIIDFQGFIELIDALGGIDVYVPEVVNDPYYSHTELPGDYFPLYFEVGWHHMDGTTALGYARTRRNSSDLDRIQRQQRVIFAAIEKARELNLIDVDKLVDLWGKYKDAIETDINDLQVPGFAALAAQFDPSRITALSLGVATVGYTTPDGRSVLLADKRMMQQIVEALLSDQQLLEEEALVEVQNGAGADALAAQVVDYLTSWGFPSSSLTTADTVDGTIRPLTEIIDFSGKNYTVERLAGLLDVPPERVRSARPDDSALRTTDADILVILGADAQAGPFAADAQGG